MDRLGEEKYELDELAKLLVDQEVLSFGRFTLTSGLKSPYYLDFASLYADPESYRLVTQLLAARVDREVTGEVVVAGVPLRGLPFALFVANLLSSPFVLLRKEEKRHGTGRELEGRWTSGDEAVVIDDVASTGGSIETAAERLRKLELEVSQAFVIVDRLQGARDRLAEIGVDLHSLAEIDSLADSLLRQHYIDEERHEEIEEYISSSP